jgi:GH15 family glucan-1,4-alpha-glucosidase
MASEGKDATIDISSVYGVFLFGVLEPNEMRLLRAFETSVKRLSEGVSAGGIARFENDDYYRVPGPSTGNPWFLTTLWHAEYLIATASSPEDLQHVRDIFSWAARYALPSGVLSEQLDPQTGAQVCAGPLAWAHATYVRAVVKYLEKLEQFSMKA